MSEDAPVTDDGDKKRQQHADDDEQDGVVVGYGAVPQTLLGLGVEPVRRPTKMIRQVQGDTDHPRRNQSDDSTVASKHYVVGTVPADVEVAVDSYESDRHQ